MNRYRITFSKTEAMRFTSHLDLHRTLERTMRRANLPLAYSQGFTPRPKLSLASALPLGFTSRAEVADFWLNESLPEEQIKEALKTSQPPGIEIHQVEAVEAEAEKLQTSLTEARYLVTLQGQQQGMEDKISQLLGMETILIEKIKKGKRKSFDLRPLICEIKIADLDQAGNQQIEMALKAEPSATGRPDQILEELGIDPLTTHIQRTDLIFG